MITILQTEVREKSKNKKKKKKKGKGNLLDVYDLKKVKLTISIDPDNKTSKHQAIYYLYLKPDE